MVIKYLIYIAFLLQNIAGFSMQHRIACQNDGILIIDTVGKVWLGGKNDLWNSEMLIWDSILAPIENVLGENLNLPPIQAVSSSLEHTLLLDEEGNVWAWGKNSDGQLGMGDTSYVKSPRRIVVTNELGNNIKFKAIAAGCWHSLILDEDGEVWSFGSDAYGQLGLGSIKTSRVPRKIELRDNKGLQKVKAIAAGKFYSLILDVDGNIWEWGQRPYNDRGGTPVQKNIIPARIHISDKGEEVRFKAIAAAYKHCLLLDENGFVWSFGSNQNQQLTSDKSVKSYECPTKDSSAPQIRAIFAISSASIYKDNDNRPVYIGAPAIGYEMERLGELIEVVSMGSSNALILDRKNNLFSECYYKFFPVKVPEELVISQLYSRVKKASRGENPPVGPVNSEISPAENGESEDQPQREVEQQEPVNPHIPKVDESQQNSSWPLIVKQSLPSFSGIFYRFLSGFFGWMRLFYESPILRKM